MTHQNKLVIIMFIRLMMMVILVSQHYHYQVECNGILDVLDMSDSIINEVLGDDDITTTTTTTAAGHPIVMVTSSGQNSKNLTKMAAAAIPTAINVNTAVTVATTNTATNCPPITPSFWPKNEKFSDYRLQYKSLNVSDINKLIYQTLDKQCQLARILGNWLKHNKLDYIAEQSNNDCQFELGDNQRVMQTISKLVNLDERLEHTIRQLRWLDYRTMFFINSIKRVRNCTFDEIVSYVNISDVNQLVKLVSNGHREALNELANEVESDRQNVGKNFWIQLDTQTLDEYKVLYANEDKQLAQLKPDSIKIPTMRLMIFKLDYLNRIYKVIHD